MKNNDNIQTLINTAVTTRSLLEEVERLLLQVKVRQDELDEKLDEISPTIITIKLPGPEDILDIVEQKRCGLGGKNKKQREDDLI